jgi:hypothetical protein
MTEEEIRERLKDRVLTRVADATGLHYATVRRFAKGQGPFHSATLRNLERYLTG